MSPAAMTMAKPHSSPAAGKRSPNGKTATRKPSSTQRPRIRLSVYFALLCVIALVFNLSLIRQELGSQGESKGQNLAKRSRYTQQAFLQGKEGLKSNRRIAMKTSSQVVQTGNQVSRIWVFIPSVRRRGDPDYLIQVLESMNTRAFPMSQVFVYNLANNEENTTQTKPSELPRTTSNLTQSNVMANTTDLDPNIHVRFEEAKGLYPETHFLTVTSADAALPPLPAGFLENGTHSIPASLDWCTNNRYCVPDTKRLEEASADIGTRKLWRRKECYDFLHIARSVLKSVESSGVTSKNDWILFNQDDGKWKFPGTWERMKMAIEIAKNLNDSKIVDFFGSGAVAMAFQKDHLYQVISFGEKWCDWLPVDWLLDLYTNLHKVHMHHQRFLKHLGKVSTKHGRVDDVDEVIKREEEKAKKAKEEKRRRKQEEARARVTDQRLALLPGRIWVVVPSFYRQGDPGFLFNTLESMENREFNMSQVFVLNMVDSKIDIGAQVDPTGSVHVEKVRTIFSNAHFAALGALNRSYPPLPPHYLEKGQDKLPVHIQNCARCSRQSLEQASQDDPERKEWRRALCFDFLSITKFFVAEAQGVSPLEPDDWFLVNRDNVKWKFAGSWRTLHSNLQTKATKLGAKVVGMDGLGSAAIAFRKDVLVDLISFGQEWCNWLPIEWVIDLFLDMNNITIGHTKNFATPQTSMG